MRKERSRKEKKKPPSQHVLLVSLVAKLPRVAATRKRLKSYDTVLRTL